MEGIQIGDKAEIRGLLRRLGVGGAPFLQIMGMGPFAGSSPRVFVIRAIQMVGETIHVTLEDNFTSFTEGVEVKLSFHMDNTHYYCMVNVVGIDGLHCKVVLAVPTMVHGIVRPEERNNRGLAGYLPDLSGVGLLFFIGDLWYWRWWIAAGLGVLTVLGCGSIMWFTT
jgi:hypothetical protein